MAEFAEQSSQTNSDYIAALEVIRDVSGPVMDDIGDEIIEGALRYIDKCTDPTGGRVNIPPGCVVRVDVNGNSYLVYAPEERN